MTLQVPNDHRRIIPRWRNSRIALTTGELLPSHSAKLPVISGLDLFAEKKRSWLENRNIITAAELVSVGLSQGYLVDSVEAANYIIDHSPSVAPVVVDIASEILVRAGRKEQSVSNGLLEIDSAELYSKIHILKQRLILYPRNPLMWVDLSRCYVLLNQRGKAQDAMSMAMKLAPKNRFVLRSAARLYVHLDQPDIAHDLLVRQDITYHDPWLLAAEIAVANVAEINPRFVKNSKELLQRNRFHPFHTAELTSALASIELFSGAHKKARKLFESSLISPTENSVAQSVWAKQWLPTLDVGTTALNIPRTYEAKTWNAYINLDWQGIVHASTDWSLDEPFSSRPAELGSYAAAIGIGDYALAESIARKGLFANPDDHGLKNNRAFALASQNNLSEAIRVLNSVSRPAPNLPTEIALTATEGMINLRSGNFEYGSLCYLNAIEMASRESLTKVGALASIFYAREMNNVGLFTKDAAIQFAEDAVRKVMSPDIKWLVEKIKQEMLA